MYSGLHRRKKSSVLLHLIQIPPVQSFLQLCILLEADYQALLFRIHPLSVLQLFHPLHISGFFFLYHLSGNLLYRYPLQHILHILHRKGFELHTILIYFLIWNRILRCKRLPLLLILRFYHPKFFQTLFFLFRKPGFLFLIFFGLLF